MLARLASLSIPPAGTSPVELLRSILYTPEFLAAHRSDLEREARAVRRPTTFPGYRRQAEASMRFDVYDRRPEIRVPALVMTGSRDALIPPGSATVIAERFPGAELHIFEGAGHGFTRERPEESARVILEFLSKVEGSSGDGPRP